MQTTSDAVAGSGVSADVQRRIRWKCLCLILALVGCDRTRGTSVSAPAASHDMSDAPRERPERPNPDVFRAPSTDDERQQSEALRAHVSSPEYQRHAEALTARVKTRNALAAASPLRFGFVDGQLPDGAAAVIVRRPGARMGRLVVFGTSTISDLAFSLSLHALREDEDEAPHPGSPRLIKVWPDQRVQDPDGTRQMHYVIPATVRGDAVWLLGARELERVVIPGIGEVRIVEDKD